MYSFVTRPELRGLFDHVEVKMEGLDVCIVYSEFLSRKIIVK